MSARIFNGNDWIAARRRLAARTQGPCRTIRRGIYIRELRNGLWAADLLTWRHGKWQPPQVLAAPTSYPAARAAAMAAWRATRLPLYYQRAGAPGSVGFRPGLVEPTLEGAA